jgi:dTDP-4-dehydrorhamnose reductase
MSVARAIPGAPTIRARPAMRPALVLIGRGGMLGRAVAEHLDGAGVSFLAPRRDDLDITKPSDVRSAVDGSCPLVINCAAWTDVDGAERDEERALAVNADAPRLLAERCRDLGLVLLHVSTDYVFDGRAASPYRVDHPRSPLGAYARSKALGEEHVERSGCAHLIVRTSWLYAPWGRSFVRTIAHLGRQARTLRVVHDQRGRPTSAQHLARTALALAARGRRGVAHVCDAGECTRFELARQVVRLGGGSARIEPCATADMPRPAPRPAYSVLDLSGTERDVGPMPDWCDNLAGVMSRIEPGQA